MHKKFFKVTTEKHVVQKDYNENFMDEYYIQEDAFTTWATKQIIKGWIVKCEKAVNFTTPEEVEFPKVIQIK